MQPGMSGPSEPAPPPPMPTAPPKKFNGKIIGGLVLVLVALILAIVCIVTSWWSFGVTIAGTKFASMDFGLRTACASVTTPISMSSCGGYAGAPGGISNVVNIAFILVLLGLLLAIIALILIFVGAKKPKLRMGVAVCGIIGSIMLLVAAVYFMVSLPDAVNDMVRTLAPTLPPGTKLVTGFFGSQNIGGADLSYGGAIGWYMAFLSFILLLVGTLVAVSGMKSQPAPAPPPM